jgi:hypothetical protein
MMWWPLPDDGSSSQGWRRQPATDDPDVRLTRQVADALLSDGRTRHQSITVEVQNRVVLLTGTVDTASARQAARYITRDVHGVADICDSLRVTGPEADDRGLSGDGERFQRIVADLQAEGHVPGFPRGPNVAMWSALAAFTWALLTVLMVTSRWDGVAAVCLAIGVTLKVVHHRRKRSARRKRP